MPHTFGGASGDDINYSAQTAWVTTGRQHLVMAWYHPTTLTAGRVYFGNSNTVGLRVGATTSELSFVIDHVTTDGVWDTSGAGITTDKWWFIAVYFTSFNTGPAADVVFWVGDVETAPQEISRTRTTAPAGNNTNNSVIAIGNQGSTGNVGFQGDITNYLHVTDGTLDTYSLFSQDVNGTIDANAKGQALRRFILPYWSGNWPDCFFLKSFGNNSLSADMILHGGTGVRVLYRYGSGTTGNTYEYPLTINGVTFSDNGAPRPTVQPLFRNQFVRR